MSFENQNIKKEIILGTHSGKFHLDEVLATAILLNIYPNARLIRSRNQDELNKADIVYDVGGIYDPKTLRFDHHQRSFKETFSTDYNVRLSSAGLVYRHFAKQLLEKYEIEPKNEVIEEIYEEYFLAIDAQDNGIENPSKYQVRTLANTVSDSKFPLEPEEEAEIENFFPNLIIESEYKKIVDGKEEIILSKSRKFKYTLKFIMRDLKNYLKIKKLFYDELNSADQKIKNCNSQILIVEEDENISQNIIRILSEKYKKEIYFVIYPSYDNTYRMYDIPKEKNSFESKIQLYEKWRGLRDHELQEISGFKNAQFVHASGFTGRASDLETAIKMCEISIDEWKKSKK